MSETHPRLGPYSRAIDRGSVGWSLDGRSREGRFLRAYEAMLAQHLGAPSTVQREMIRRCARLALHLELQDEKLLAGEPPSDHTTRQYLAWHGALVRTLKALGLQAAPPPQQDWRDFLANWQSPAAATARAEPSQASQTPSVASRSSAPVDAAA